MDINNNYDDEDNDSKKLAKYDHSFTILENHKR